MGKKRIIKNNVKRLETPRGYVRAGIVTGDGKFYGPRQVEAAGLRLFKDAMDDMVHVERTGDMAKALTPRTGIQPSNEIPDEQSTSFNYTGVRDVIEPPYNYDILAELMNFNITHEACIMNKTGDYAYNGWELVLRPGVKELGISDIVIEQARMEVIEWLSSCVDGMLPIEDLVRDIAIDRDGLGTCGFEIRRDRRGFIGILNHVPMVTMRALKSMLKNEKNVPHFVQSRYNKHRYFVPINDNVSFTNPNFDPIRASIRDFPPFDKRQQFIRLRDSFSHAERQGQRTRRYTEAATEFFLLARTPKTDSTVYGRPTAQSAYSAMLGEMRADQFNLNFFNSKGVPQYAVVVSGLSMPGTSYADVANDGDPIAELEQTIQEFFEEKLHTADRNVLVMAASGEAEIKFERLSPASIEASFMDYEKRMSEKIRMAHEVPPAALGIVQTANIGSGRESSQLIRYRDHVVSPGQRVFAAVVNILIRSGLLIPYFNFRFLPMPVDDEAERRKFKLDEFERGGITPNEYRTETGRTPFTSVTAGEDAGDNLYIRNAQLTIVDRSGRTHHTMPGDEPRLEAQRQPVSTTGRQNSNGTQAVSADGGATNGEGSNNGSAS